MANDPSVELNPIATRVLYEDDEVRIWDQVIEPGGTTGPHRHDLEYALINIDGESIEVAPVPGMTSPHIHETLELPIEPRAAFTVPRGSAEIATNRSGKTYRAILVEFKDSD